MKIALCQLNYHIGHFESNRSKILTALEKAKENGADLAVFAELAICGYPPRDFLEFDDFIQQCESSLHQIAKACIGISAIVGCPQKNTSGKGKPLYNAAFLLENGKVSQVTHKALLPTYDIFDEYRYFEPGREFALVNWKGMNLALTICEDLWQTDGNKLYESCPMDVLSHLKPDLLINIAASPFDYNHADERKEVLCWNSKTYQVPLVYVNQIGAQTELIFDGGSLCINAQGEICQELSYFAEEIRIVNFPFTDEKVLSGLSTTFIGDIHQALLLGIKDYFGKMGFKKAILGLSGGIDSAVVACLAAQALGAENVRGILMPSEFSSDHSITDALALAENLGIAHAIVPIKQNYDTVLESLKPLFGSLPFGLAEENLQARIRGVVLMGISNKFGEILLNTSNKSEAAVGYGTLYGDMNGGLSVLGDLYKTQVYDLAHYINRKWNLIPVNSISKPPSAELRPGQKDSDSLPDYTILDKVLYQYIEERKGPTEIIAMGFNEELVRRILKLVNNSEYKRHQTPPILRISSKAFGMGRRMPIVGHYLS
ncbi:MAG: NAD+ synthase [Bacteroidia bacterium]|nr:NAD+ synthase [Bacteroidia bacterium]